MVSPNGFLPSQAAPVFLTQDGTVVDNSNPLDVAATFSGTISASSAAQANAAPPVWTEGSLEPFSQNLHGALRITPSITGTDLTTFPVSGTVTAQGTLTIIPSGTQTVTGSLTVTQATGTNLHTVVDSGTLTLGSVQGLAASGASVSGNPLLGGGRAQNAEQTAVTNGQAIDIATDLVGRQIVFPYANKENLWSGAISSTGTTAVTIEAAPGANVKLYATSLQIGNTGTVTVAGTLNDSATTILVVPSGGGSNLTLPAPLVWAANTAATITFSAATTTAYASAQGFKGT